MTEGAAVLAAAEGAAVMTEAGVVMTEGAAVMTGQSACCLGGALQTCQLLHTHQAGTRHTQAASHLSASLSHQYSAADLYLEGG